MSYEFVVDRGVTHHFQGYVSEDGLLRGRPDDGAEQKSSKVLSGVAQRLLNQDVLFLAPGGGPVHENAVDCPREHLRSQPGVKQGGGGQQSACRPDPAQ